MQNQGESGLSPPEILDYVRTSGKVTAAELVDNMVCVTVNNSLSWQFFDQVNRLKPVNNWAIACRLLCLDPIVSDQDIFLLPPHWKEDSKIKTKIGLG